MLYANAIHLLYTLGPGALVQDLNPDDLRIDLMVSHEPDVVTQVTLTVKRLDRGVIVTHPVLRVDTYSHSY